MMNPQQFAGLKEAAEVLLARLKEKDYKKWLEVVMFSPPELIGSGNANSIAHEELGRSIKKLCENRHLSLRMGKDGVVRGT